MDEAFFCRWFKGFENGLDAMDEESRRDLLKHCARQCADTGVLRSHFWLYHAVNGNRDEFYRRLSETGNVRGEVLVPGKEYRVYYPECACDLHTAGGVSTPKLCECSRQSILYTTEAVWKGSDPQVIPEGTILSGAAECRFRIIFR